MNRRFAKIETSGLVSEIVVADSAEWCEQHLGGIWVETFKDRSQRYNYAAIGHTYDPSKGTDGAFIPPKPFDSWILNEETCLWEAPIPYPNDGLVYSWDEESGDWIEVVEPSA